MNVPIDSYWKLQIYGKKNTLPISPGCNGAPVGEIFLMEFLCGILPKKGPSKRIRMLPGEIRGHKLFKQFFLNNWLKIIFLPQKYFSRKI